MQAATRTMRWRSELDVVGRILWRLPGSFRIAHLLGSYYSLRCVLFHHVATSDTAFTKGLGISTSRVDFESALKFLKRYYTPVSLQDVLDESDARRLPPRPVLVTFDDAYASIREVAAPLCKDYDVPAVCFVNAAYLDNRQLALDNLVCYVMNEVGLRGINSAANSLSPECFEFESMADVFGRFLPTLSLPAREAFRTSLLELLGTGEADLLTATPLYLTSAQLQELTTFDCEIGNHTYTHVHCRSLTGQDFEREVGRNKRELEAVTGKDVRSFSVPYGCSEDLQGELIGYLQQTGHQAAFLVESLPNGLRADCYSFNRVSVRADQDAGFFSELEILPRFPAIRKWLSGKPTAISGYQSADCHASTSFRLRS